MEGVDFSELKLSVGRPEEGKIDKVKLKPAVLSERFERRFKRFFGFWDSVVITKANKLNKPKYVSNMEEYYGEVLEKFEGLSTNKKKSVLASATPLKLLYKLTNLSYPNVFHNKEDNEDFIRVLKTARL